MSKAAELAAYQAGLKTALIEFTDGDDAIAIADAGVVTLLTTAVAKSEGGAVTTNIAQGLAKAWLSMANDFAIDDSLNMASVTDAATGKYSHAYTNNMSNATYTINAGGNSGALNTTFIWVEPTVFATSGAQASTGTSAHGGTVALGDNGTVTTVHGDLA